MQIWCRAMSAEAFARNDEKEGSEEENIVKMFAWGSTVHGELGLGGIEDEHILAPKSMEWFLAQDVTVAACGPAHTLLVTKDGKVYSCGSNDFGQLGHDQPRKRPQLVTGLDVCEIVDVACGNVHSLALDRWGQVYAWGSDASGQLGHQLNNVMQSVPKLVKHLATARIVQIACGNNHSMALSDSGDMYVWGSNTYGQLGLGKDASLIGHKPRIIESLAGIPIAFIACGGSHSFALSKSGAVYGWGKNTEGQLGLNDQTSKWNPCQLRTLRNIKVRYISCGDEFSTFLTLDGGVLSCGSGSYGQLGHGTNSNEILPRQVIELMGSTITQISCGRQHTLALVPSRGRVYSFGLGGAGQLGRRLTSSASTPQVVLGPWMSPSGSTVLPTDKTECSVVFRIFAGGDHCFVKVFPKGSNDRYDSRVYSPHSQILMVDYQHLSKCLKIESDKPVDQETLQYLETTFKSLACINGSFLLPNEQHYYCTSKHHGVNLDLAEKAFSTIGKFENQAIKDLIWNSLTTDVIPNLKESPPDVETLRIYLTLPFYYEFNNPKHYKILHTPFAKSVLKLHEQPTRVLGRWWSSMKNEYFERLVNVFKSVCSYIIGHQVIPENDTVRYDASLVAMLDLLNVLNKLNHSVEGLKVSYDTFHLTDLSDYVDVRVDYVAWLTDTSPSRFFLCNYPFIFDAHAKIQLLETDQTLQMQSAMSQAAHQAIFQLLVARQIPFVNQFLLLNVSRDNIVADALRELSSVSSSDLKKPLKVKFQNEEAEDAGGVRKEFFMLLLRAILDPNYGMFKMYTQTRNIWFAENSFEEEEMFFLIGVICGLVIYNYTIIDLPFPLALYKKLLKEPVVLSDLKCLDPTQAKSLQAILDHDGTDLEDVFCMNFEISRDVFGEVVTSPLKPNGENIPVTHENREEFVRLYVDFIFNKSIAKQYQPFHAGFMKVCGGRVLELFHSHELMAVVVGNENYDWHALEEAAEYKNGYKSSDQIIRWFWEVLHDMSLEDKKKFLLFLTGSDRIPIQGMKAIKIIIQPTTDEKYLPVAHTCFNLLDLPRYNTKEKLKYKLLQAIQQTEGFSLV